METFAEQFRAALSRIEVSGSRQDDAAKAHKEVRGVLESAPELKEMGVDTILIGSYSRHTGIYPGKDVDVFVKLPRRDTSSEPKEIFGALNAALVKHYVERAEPQRRSTKIAFKGSGPSADDNRFSVDAVGAVGSATNWAIPDISRGGKQSSWVKTNPERLGELTTVQNQRKTIDGKGAYVPVVKLVRQAREAHLGKARPGGLYFELLTYSAFDAGIPGQSYAEAYAQTLRAIAQQLASGQDRPLLDPVLMTPFLPKPSSDDLIVAARLFDKLAAKAEQALQLPKCEAAVIWRQILGRNGRGQCFPLPNGCDETGRVIGAFTVNTGRGTNEARPFAARRHT
jgi:SMODS domain-containing protein